MARWEGWRRTRHDPDTPPDQYQQALARKVLGELMEGVKRGGLFQNKIRRTFADGTVVIAQFDGTTPMVQVFNPQPTGVQEPTLLTSLWIPRGFVFVPGNADAPQGWGLPVRQQPGDTAWPFGAQNLAPGLDVTRWTANGPAAQVLLTRDDTTRYPDPRRQQLPVGYDAREWRASMTWTPKPDAWHVVRPTFQGFDWTPDVRGVRIALWRSVTGKLGRDLMALPFAGFYDDAQVWAANVQKYGSDQAHWPNTYNSTPARAYKDGVRGSYAEAGFMNGTPQQLADGLTLTDTAVQIDVGVDGGITTATERTAKEWIRCGNLFWHPDDPALPTLTWDGYPAQNLPLWLVQGAWTAGVGSTVFPLEGWWYEWRGQQRYVWSKNLYAMGRCIGVLPDTVIAAAIRKETVPIDGQPGKTKSVNRVVVITWRASDQGTSGGYIAYLRTFRVWCVDFDATAEVPLHVSDVPVGAYDATTNPTGWRECGTFDSDSDPGFIPGLPRNSLWQMPRFNGDGSRAVASVGVLYTDASGTSEWRGGTFGREYVFDTIEPGTLDWSTVISVPYQSSSFLLAVDYSADGLKFARMMPEGVLPFPLKPTTTPEGNPCTPNDGVVYWGDDGAWEPLGNAGDFGPPFFVTTEYWVLDAATGAMALLDHWNACYGMRYDVRLTYGGARIDVSWMADTVGVREVQTSGMNWLDRLNASFVRDRDGHYVMGYDLGTTKNATVVYASMPVCGQAVPPAIGAPVSTYFGSRWLSDVGNLQELAQVGGSLRAYPLGVV